MKTPKDIGFHNIDPSLKKYRIRIDGKEVGPVISFQEAVDNCSFLRKQHGIETWKDHFNRGGDAE